MTQTAQENPVASAASAPAAPAAGMPSATPQASAPTSVPQIPQAQPTQKFIADEPKKGGGNFFQTLLIIILFILIGVSGYYVGANQKMLQRFMPHFGPVPTPIARPTGDITPVAAVPTVTPTPDPTASWLTYTNTKFMYSIKYPQNLKPNEVTSPYYYVDFKDASASAGQLATYIVSVIPQTFTVANPSAYNYMSSDWINSVSTIAVGQGKAMDSAATFIRLPDTTVDGQPAMAIEVSTKTYKQHRIYVKNGGNIYMISNYYLTPILPTDFQDFVSSFKFAQ